MDARVDKICAIATSRQLLNLQRDGKIQGCQIIAGMQKITHKCDILSGNTDEAKVGTRSSFCSPIPRQVFSCLFGSYTYAALKCLVSLDHHLELHDADTFY